MFRIITTLIVIAYTNAICNKHYENSEDPLVLTPLIEAGEIEKAQNLSIVRLQGFEDIRSYSGHLTVNKIHNSKLFFWYFVAEKNPDDAPVILWLQGGPGYPSMYGIILENGPFEIKSDHLIRRSYSWHKYYHMIYIDNPVGTGYSTAEGEYAQNQNVIGEGLYKALIQFFKLFPNLQQHDFYVTGQSYAGKFVPTIAHTIHKKNHDSELKINLKGLAIGNGFISPIHQDVFSDSLYHTGLINLNQASELKNIEKYLMKCILNKDWMQALILSRKMYGTYGLLLDYTKYSNFYNILRYKYEYTIDMLYDFMNSPYLRSSLHVGNGELGKHYYVFHNLNMDFMQSSMDFISELLSDYKVFIYNGNLDIVIGYTVTEKSLMDLTCSGCDEFRNAKRKMWMIDGELAGYTKNGGNLTLFLVRNAGHCVPGDQPKWAMDIINQLTNNNLL